MSPLAFNVTSLAAGCLELVDVSLSGFFFRMTVSIAAVCRQFRTSFVHAFTQTNISGISVPGTPVPALSGPILLQGYPSKYASTFGISWSVNFSTRSAELTQAVSGWPCLKELPNSHGFCVICNITQSKHCERMRWARSGLSST